MIQPTYAPETDTALSKEIVLFRVICRFLKRLFSVMDQYLLLKWLRLTTTSTIDSEFTCK